MKELQILWQEIDVSPRQNACFLFFRLHKSDLDQSHVCGKAFTHHHWWYSTAKLGRQIEIWSPYPATSSELQSGWNGNFTVCLSLLTVQMTAVLNSWKNTATYHRPTNHCSTLHPTLRRSTLSTRLHTTENIIWKLRSLLTKNVFAH